MLPVAIFHFKMEREIILNYNNFHVSVLVIDRHFWLPLFILSNKWTSGTHNKLKLL